MKDANPGTGRESSGKDGEGLNVRENAGKGYSVHEGTTLLKVKEERNEEGLGVQERKGNC